MSRTPFPKYDEALVAQIEECLEMDHLTEIINWSDIGVFDEGGGVIDSHLALHSRGSALADIDNAVTPRLMIQSLCDNPRGERMYTNNQKPCPRCDNFAVSWKCTEHPELEYKGRGVWVAPGVTRGLGMPDELSDAFNTVSETITRHPDGQPLTSATYAQSHDVDPDGSVMRVFIDAMPANATPAEANAVVRQYIDRLNEIGEAMAVQDNLRLVQEADHDIA